MALVKTVEPIGMTFRFRGNKLLRKGILMVRTSIAEDGKEISSSVHHYTLPVGTGDCSAMPLSNAEKTVISGVCQYLRDRVPILE